MVDRLRNNNFWATKRSGYDVKQVDELPEDIRSAIICGEDDESRAALDSVMESGEICQGALELLYELRSYAHRDKE